MRIIQVSILIFLCGLNSFAQVEKTDSLLSVLRNSKDIAVKMTALKSLATINSVRNFDECLQYCTEGMKLAAGIRDSSSIGEFDRLAGLAWYFKGEYDSAAVLYYRSLSVLQQSKDQKLRALTLNELGKLYRKTRDLDRALQHYNEALSIYSNLQDESEMATIYNESGVVFEYKGDYEEALSRYRKSLAIREKKQDILGRSYSLSFIGGVYALQKDFANARKYITASLQDRIQIKDSLAISLSYVDLGYLYKEMKQYDSAIAQYEAANKLAMMMKYPQLQMENYRNMAEIEELRKNPAKSLTYLKSYSALKDSIISTEKLRQIEELNARYQAEKKEQQLKLQQAEISKKNILIWGIVSIALVAVYAGFSTFRKNQAQNRLQLQEAVSREQEQATRSILEAEENERKRIAAELHDGIGQMMSAAKMNLSVFEHELPFSNDQQKKSFENVISLVDMSCREIRSVSHQMMPNALLKKGLSDAIREFIDRIDHRVISISLHTEGLNDTLDLNTESVLYRVIQECVNNVLKHAAASRLDILLIHDPEGLSITLEDNGKGFDTVGLAEKEGIGIRNIRSRVNYLKGTVEIDSQPGRGTLVAIHIPQQSPK